MDANANLIDPMTHSEFANPTPVASPARRSGPVPRINRRGDGTFDITQAEGGGPGADEQGEDAFLQAVHAETRIPESLAELPAYQALSNKGRGVHAEVTSLVENLRNLIEQCPDDIAKAFRVALSNRFTPIVNLGQVSEEVRTDLLCLYNGILANQAWLFQAVLVLLGFNHSIPVPKVLRQVCSLAAFHAILSYASIVDPATSFDDPSDVDEADVDAVQKAFDDAMDAHKPTPEEVAAAAKISREGLPPEFDDALKGALRDKDPVVEAITAATTPLDQPTRVHTVKAEPDGVIVDNIEEHMKPCFQDGPLDPNTPGENPERPKFEKLSVE